MSTPCVAVSPVREARYCPHAIMVSREKLVLLVTFDDGISESMRSVIKNRFWTVFGIDNVFSDTSFGGGEADWIVVAQDLNRLVPGTDFRDFVRRCVAESRPRHGIPFNIELPG